MQKQTLSRKIFLSISGIVWWFFVLGILPTVFTSVSAATISPAPQAYQTLANYAIQLSKQATSVYGEYTLTHPNAQSTTITLTERDILATETSFKNQINTSWHYGFSSGWNSGFLADLAKWNQAESNTANNTALSDTVRATAMLSNDLYKNYLLLWNNPKFNSAVLATKPTTVITTNPTSPTTTGLTQYSTYKTTSWKIYTIWKTSDGRYLYKETGWYSFTNLWALYDFLEYQNRIIYTAPNGRRYGIFKYNIAYRFNRDDGSMSTNKRISVEDVKAYINQHNQPVAWCTKVYQWRCVQ